MGTPVDRSITFNGPGTQTVQLEGRFVRVLAADASGVTIKPSPGSPLLRYAGQDVDAGPQGFNSFDVTVTVASTVKLCVSDTRQADNQTNVNATVSATIAAGGVLSNGGDVVCPTGQATQIWAGSAAQLTVAIRSSDTNTYAEGTVRIGTTAVAANSGLELNPGDMLSLDTTAPVFAYNSSGASVTLQVLGIAS